METGKYYLTKEEQLQREKWDWYSMLKTAELKGYAKGFLDSASERFAKSLMAQHNENSAEDYEKRYTQARKLARVLLAIDLLENNDCHEFIAKICELPMEKLRKINEELRKNKQNQAKQTNED